MNNQSLEVFSYEGTPIQVLGDPKQPLFIAKEVCDALNIADHKSALRKLRDDEKGEQTLPTPGGKQVVLVVTKPGLYRLIFRSNKPEAERFRDWVMHEVLPSIDEKGYYQLEAAKEEHARAEQIMALQQKVIDLQEKLLEIGSDPGKRKVMPPGTREQKEEAYRLRTEKNLTYEQIGHILGGYSDNTVSVWVAELRKEQEGERDV